MSALERCGARAPGFKLSCDLAPDHAKDFDDWHESRAETKQAAQDYEHISSETVRWAPAPYELLRKPSKTTP